MFKMRKYVFLFVVGASNVYRVDQN